jgi:hypothetical protein
MLLDLKVLVASIAPTANDVGAAYLRVKDQAAKGISIFKLHLSNFMVSRHQ